MSFFGQAKDSQTYTIGVENLQYAPHFYISREGKALAYRGFAREIFDLFQEYYNSVEKLEKEKEGVSFSKIKLVYKPLPVKRLLTSLMNGRIDFKYPDNKFWGLDKKKEDSKKFARLRYSKPVTPYVDGILVHPKWSSKNNKLKKIVTVLGFTPFPYLKPIKEKKITLQYFPTLSSVLKVISKGKFDGAYVNVQVGFHKQKELLASGIINKQDALTFNDKFPSDKSNYHISTIKHHHILDAFNRFLKNKIFAKRILELRKKNNLDF
jgi:ABC-type amino acid transport substrate-binding protein